MKLHPEDPRLTAYLLGELSSEDAAAVERAAAADPAVRLALRDLERVQLLLTDTLAPARTELLPRQRENVRRSARQADREGKVVALPSQRRSWRTWAVPAAVAAAVVLAVTVLVRLPAGPDAPATASGDDGSSERAWGEIPLEIALLPAPGPADASRGAGAVRPTAGALAERAAARDAALARTGEVFLREVTERLAASPAPAPSDLPEHHPRGPVAAAEHPELPLPVLCGRASLGWIEHAVREANRLPDPKAVRLEEILNAFPLRPAGDAAVAAGVTLSTEIVPCPWKPSSVLLLVSIRGASDAAREVRPVFHADPAVVRRYRLLGFNTLPGVEPGALPGRLPAKAATTLALEIEPLGASTAAGRIEWSVDGQPAPTVAPMRRPDVEPSDDARFAALICTFSQWLGREQNGIIDAELVAALARENDSPDLPKDRHDLLGLIQRALSLDAAGR